METKRDFQINDLELIQHCETALAFLKKSLQDFHTLDTTYTTKKLVELEVLIAASKLQPDEQIKDEQGVLTQQVTDLLIECENYFKQVTYFVKKAFKENLKVQHVLGINDFAAAKRTKLGVINFMQVLSETLPKYEAQLLEVGMNRTTLNTANTLHQHLHEASLAQQLFKRNRKQLTVDRIEQMNRLYAAFQELEELAILVYSNNMTALQTFVVPRYKGAKGKKVKGITITGNAKILALVEEITRGQLLHLENRGSVDLHFYVSDDTNKEVAKNAVVVQANEDLHVLAEVISDGDMGRLVVWNSGEEEGLFEVQVI